MLWDFFFFGEDNKSSYGVDRVRARGRAVGGGVSAQTFGSSLYFECELEKLEYK